MGRLVPAKKNNDLENFEVVVFGFIVLNRIAVEIVNGLRFSLVGVG
jgi:hypothetical protein